MSQNIPEKKFFFFLVDPHKTLKTINTTKTADDNYRETEAELVSFV